MTSSKPHLGAEAQLPGQHGSSEVGVDQHGSARSSGQGLSQGQDQGCPPLGPVAAREEEHLQILAVAGLDQGIGKVIEAVAELTLQRADRGGPLQGHGFGVKSPTSWEVGLGLIRRVVRGYRRLDGTSRKVRSGGTTEWSVAPRWA